MAAPSLLLVGAGLSLAGGFSAADANANALEASADTLLTQGLNNLMLSEQRADEIREAGKALQSEQRAAFAASGVEVSSGSPLQIQSLTAEDAELAAIMELNAGEMAFKQAQDEANRVRRAARRSRRAGRLGTLGRTGLGVATGLS